MVKVGVILNHKNKNSSLIDGVQIAIYENIDSKWKKSREVKKCFKKKETMNQMRNFLLQLILELRDCKILIGSVITGIPFLILDKEGFMLCEADEITDELLTSVANDYENKEHIEKNIMVYQLEDYPTTPYQTEETGTYEFDMRRFQTQYPEISSKKALIPFIRDVEFKILYIYCNHVMPWLEFELPMRGLKYRVERNKNENYMVIIEHIEKERTPL